MTCQAPAKEELPQAQFHQIDVALRLGDREVEGLSVCCKIATQRWPGRIVEANKQRRITAGHRNGPDTPSPRIIVSHVKDGARVGSECRHRWRRTLRWIT